MKKLLFSVLAIMLLFSCSKQDSTEAPNNASHSSKNTFKEGGIWRGKKSCKLKDGTGGTECKEKFYSEKIRIVNHKIISWEALE